jgi:hypothetical protein
MKNLSILLYAFAGCCLFLLFDPHAAAANATYYIDSVSGNDSYNGTSTSTPWKTAAAVNSRTFGPGDKILFKAGSVWSGERFVPHGSGQSGNPITIDMYDAGAKPILNGNGTVNELIYLEDQQYWTIQNLEITNNAAVDAGNRRGIFVKGQNGGTLNGIHLLNLDIHDIKGVPWGNIRGRGDQYTCGSIMVWVYNGTTPTKFNDLRIENTNFWHSTAMAINMQSDYAAASMFDNNRKWTNVVVKNVTTQDIGASAIIIADTDGLVVENVATLDNGFYVDDYAIGVMVPNFEIRSYNTTYQFNESGRQNPTDDSQAWDVDFGNSGLHLYQYNYSHDNPGGVFMWCDPLENGTRSTIVFRYNISQNDKDSRIRFACSTGGALMHVYNNTFYTDNPTEHVRIQDDNGLVRATFENNIFYAPGTGDYPQNSRFTYSNNLYFGHTGASSDAFQVTADPQFITPGAGMDGRASAIYYKLRPSSPAINAGKVIANNGGKDYFGNTLYSGAPDIGAHEYVSEALPLPATHKSVNVNDNTTGTSNYQFVYSGSWTYNTSGVGYNYRGDEHFSNQTNADAQVKFYGSQFTLWGIKDSAHGIAAISVDGGPEVMVDFYSPVRQLQHPIYKSPVLSNGQHTVKIRITGTKNAASNNTFLSLDKIQFKAAVEYRILARHSGKALDVEGASTANGANVLQWSNHGGANQKWIRQEVGGGYNEIIGRNSGKVLDVSNASTANGANVQQWEYGGGTNQQWSIAAVSGGYYQIINRNSGKVLDVANASTADGANVYQWAYGGGSNQEWSIVE